LYLTYKMYRAGPRESESAPGAIPEAAHDAILTMEIRALNIREFNPAAEHMFGIGGPILGRRVDLLLRSPIARRSSTR